MTAFFGLGLHHILDIAAFDHILFVLALVAGESGRWRRLVLMVTAFTLGHTVTLALATLDVVRLDPAWVEFLIPLTIVITSALNVLETRASAGGVRRAELAKYALTVVFGLVHGLGFSNFLRAALGAEESLLLPLLGFNLGVEAGQLVVVSAAAALGWLVTRLTRLTDRQWLLVLSAATGAIALVIMVQRIP